MSAWEVKSLGDVLKLEYGKPLAKEDRDEKGAYPAYGANGIKCRTNNYFHDKPSIIVGRKGSAGEVTLTEQKFWPLDVAYFVKFDERRHDLMFLYHCLKSLKLTKLAVGVKPGINRNDVYRLQFDFPPLAEQKRIVAILDGAFEGIAAAVSNAEKNLANARELFESALITAVFKDFDQNNWQLTTVADVALPVRGSIRTGPFGSQLLHSEFVDAGIAVLGIDNAVENEFRWGKKRFIRAEKFGQLSRYQVKPGDVLITIMGTCGRCAIVPDDIPTAINTKHLCCISLDRSQCLPEFLHAYFLYHPMAQGFLTDRAKGSIMSGLNMGIIKELPLRLPSLPEQQIVIEKLNFLSHTVRRLEAMYQKKLDGLAELKQSILQKAFAGELTSKPEHALQEALA